MRVESEEFTALCSIIQYYQFRNAPTTIIKRPNLAKSIGVDRTFFNNFIAGKSLDRRETDRNKILDFFRTWLRSEDGYPTCPDFIQKAAEIVYKGDFGSDRIESILRQISDHSDDTLKSFNNTHVGVYHVLRYSAHQGSEYQPVKSADRKNTYYWITHAAMQIFPVSRQRYSRFTIFYRSCKRGGRDLDIYTVDGEIVVIHRHMYFFGLEHATKYPLLIVAQYNAQRGGSFMGFIIRNNFQSSSIFAARVLFIKDNTVNSVDEMKDNIYIELDKDIEPIIPFEKSELRNIGNNDGYGGIIL